MLSFAYIDCKTVGGQFSNRPCVFPFTFKGKSYNNCTTVDSISGKAWCAVDIQPFTEVPHDGLHWGDCESHCPGAGLTLQISH